MATIQHKRSGTSGVTPLATELADGEIAVNTADGKLFTKHGTSVVTLNATAAQGTAADNALPTSGGTMTGNLKLNDNVELRVGSGNPDFRMRHNASNTQLQNYTGQLQITNFTNDSDVRILTDDSSGGVTDYFRADGSTGDAILYHYGSEKLKTQSGGVTVTGTLAADGLSLGDDENISFGANNDLQIRHEASGSHSVIRENGSGSLYIDATNLFLRSRDFENMAKFYANGSVELYSDNAKKFQTTLFGVDVYGSSTNVLSQFLTSDGVTRGYLNANSSGNIGFLDSGGSWAYQHQNDTHHLWQIANASKMKLELDGDLHVDGDVVAYSTTVSDKRLKDQIEPIKNALSKVNEINGVTFVRKKDGEASAGVIAQDVLEVLPEAVKSKTLPLYKENDEQEYYLVEYDAVTGLLVEAIKELSEKVKILDARVTELGGYE